MYSNYTRALAILASAAIAAGCSSMAADDTRVDAGSSSVSTSELQASQQRINELESALAAKDRDLAEARIASSSASSSKMTDASSLFPPNPKPGECYARVLIPATIKTVTEQVMTRDASERFDIIPARYETVSETVLVKEASTKLEVVPAVYGEVQERVLVKPASKTLVEIPAQYKTVTERVTDKPAHTEWKKGPATVHASNVLSQATTDTGEIMCLVEVPATYKTVEKRVLVSPARTEETVIPAEYKTLTRTVVKQPATTREVAIPAQYDTVNVTKLVSPAKETRIAIPAEYQTVTRRERSNEERMEWRQVMCEVNMTRDNVLALQKALADEGYYKAGLDGIIGRETLGAARRYALDNNLPAGSNYVPMQVVKSLNLDL
ncbi:MAG: peptidoglycan-binding protein [Gammaproteobacteria bacterium]|nr:peptidoglycan-binding protein [Gammaproteobacteria bacterium]